MAENQYPNLPQSSDEIVQINKSLSALDSVERNLYEKVKLAKTPKEAQNYLQLIEQRQAQIERKVFTEFQLEETKNQIKYDRKFAVYKEGLTTAFSVASIILGLSLTASMSLISPLLIILGVIKPLGYSINEVVELLRGLIESTRTSKELSPNQKDKNLEKSD